MQSVAISALDSRFRGNDALVVVRQSDNPAQKYKEAKGINKTIAAVDQYGIPWYYSYAAG